MKLSIVIPVYNVKEYLIDCIESILSKKLKNIEILLVDDGSTDGSEYICDEYGKKYNFIKVFHKQNGGSSSARNLGIKKAKGEFIMFVDSDDFLYSDCNINKILLNLKSDVIQYKMLYYYSNKSKFIQGKDLKENIIIGKNNIFNCLEEEVIDGTFSVSPCDKIVKRKILIDNNIFFDENIVGEDIDWSLKLYINIKSMAIFNQNIYCYRQSRKNSITNVISSKNIEDLLYILKKWAYFEYDNYKIKDVYLNYLAYQYLILISCISKENYKKYYDNDIKNLKFILNYSKNYKVRLCKFVLKIFGYKIGIKIFKVYISLKNKGIVKI